MGGQPVEPGVGEQGPRRVATRRRVDQDVGQGQAAPEVALVAGEVLLDDDDLDAGQALAHEARVARVVAGPGRPFDRVLADPAGAQDRDGDRRPVRREERRPAPLEGLEGGRHAVAGHVAQVLDEPPAVVAGDHVERDRLDAEAAQQLDPLRPGGEVEHRDEDRAGPEQLVAALGRPQHDDDVLGVGRRLVDDVDPRRGGAVGVVRIAHAEPAPGLDEDVGAHLREQADQRRQEGAPLAGLVVHAREAEREVAIAGHAREHRTARTGPLGAGQRVGRSPGWAQPSKIVVLPCAT